MDFDPAVAGIGSQPFWLFWVADGKVRSHAPDYFARRVDGSAVVVGCRPPPRLSSLPPAEPPTSLMDDLAAMSWL